MSRDLLIVFTRYPRPGEAKTRLIPELGPDGAAHLQREMTGHSVLTARAAQAVQGFDLQVCYAGGGAGRLKHWLGAGIAYRPQGEGDLGQRMLGAFREAHAARYERMVLIGTDCPMISADILQAAFRELDTHDLSLGPAADGGYYLIGLKRPVAALFEDIPWGSETVLRRTLAAAGEQNLSIGWLPPLADVDRPQDLPYWQAVAPPAAVGGDADRVSVIIPALNEARGIARTVERAREGAEEVIVVDGGSSDATAEAAEKQGALVLTSPPGRAIQMNAGSLRARHEILVFLHADTILPRRFARIAKSLLAREGTAGGAFGFGIREPVPGRRVLELLTNWRSRWLGMPYGDQALFIYHQRFRELGGFACLPILEDVDFVRRVRRQGRLRTAAVPAVTSGRRWEQLGFWRTSAINRAIMLGYGLGVSPRRLAALYACGKRAAVTRPE